MLDHSVRGWTSAQIVQLRLIIRAGSEPHAPSGRALVREAGGALPTPDADAGAADGAVPTAAQGHSAVSLIGLYTGSPSLLMI